jgi:hypothetical protein
MTLDSPLAPPTPAAGRQQGRLVWGLLAVPPLYLAVILWLQPADHFGLYPDTAPWLGRLVYDDYDVAAYALPGLNARQGRTAGLPEEDWFPGPEEFARALDDPERPLQERYHLEYPHAALLLFRLGWVWQPEPQAPAAAHDAGYHVIARHVPRNEAEQRLWRQFRRAAQTYLFLMAGAYAALMAVLRTGYEPGGGLAGPAALLLLPAALYFGVNRFDVVPALLTASSLACLGRQRPLASAVLLGAATMVKVYPVLLAPLVFRFLWPQRRAALGWLAAYGLTAAAFLLPPLLLSGWETVWAPYRFQLARRPFPPTAYGYVLPQSLQENDWLGQGFRAGSLLLVLLLLLWRRPADLAGLLRRGALILILFVTLPVFYSPQWVVWLMPMLVPLAGRSRAVLALTVVLDVVTYLTFPVIMELPGEDWPFLGDLRPRLLAVQPVLLGVVVYGRFLALAAMAGALAWWEWCGLKGGKSARHTVATGP